MENKELKPSKPFPNGTTYEIFLDNFCYRCKKHKEDEQGFCAYVEEGGCPIENAMEEARFGNPFPSDDIVQVENEVAILVWHACSKFETDDTDLMKEYNKMMGRAENGKS